VCTLSETNCSDGLDNDGDLLTDLGDPDCELGGSIDACGAGEALFIYSSVDVPRDIPDSGNATSVVTATHAGVIRRAVVRLSILHTYDEDLLLSLMSPLGLVVTVCDSHGFDGNNFTGTIFDSECPTPIASGSSPFSGCFAPDESLTGYVGQQAMGTWALYMADQYAVDSGRLTDWSLALCVTP